MLKVSVLIPLYNSENNIVETIQSVLNQTYTNIEVIVVNDGSTDESLNRISLIEDDRLIVVDQENKGASAARNTAFDHSTGELIQYLDADDLLEEHKIEKQIELFLEANDSACLISGVWGRFFDAISNVKWEHQEIDEDYDQPYKWLLDSWQGKGMAQPGIWLTPRSVIEKAGKWNESISLNDDGEFFCRVLLQSSKIIFCPEAKVYYRSGDVNSLSNVISDRSLQSQFLSLKCYKEEFEKKDLLIGHEKVFSDLFYGFMYSFKTMSTALLKEVDDYVKTEYLQYKSKFHSVNALYSLLVPVLGFYNVTIFRNRLFKIYSKS